MHHRGLYIIDNGASRHRTRNARFRARRADHSTTNGTSRRQTRNTRFRASHLSALKAGFNKANSSSLKRISLFT